MRTCSVDGCDLPHKGKGYCTKHWERFRRYGDPLGGGTFRYPRPAECTVEGCFSEVSGGGLCHKHYIRLRIYGDVNGGKFHHSDERRDWHAAESGYVVRYEPGNPNSGSNGYVYQHRHVMSEMIGRPLEGCENVHHKNGVRSDNRPGNLELWLVGQPAGQRVQDQVAWATDILKRYGDLANKLAA